MQTFGCIDGTHVPILHPIENSQDYYCYKMFFSLTVQAVCAYRGVFMDVENRWPCSVHVAKVFCNLIINKNLQNGKLPKTHQQILAGRQKVGNYLVGDTAYALTPYCWTNVFICNKTKHNYLQCICIYVCYVQFAPINLEKQFDIGILMKMWFWKLMQKIYRRVPMPYCYRQLQNLL